MDDNAAQGAAPLHEAGDLLEVLAEVAVAAVLRADDEHLEVLVQVLERGLAVLRCAGGDELCKGRPAVDQGDVGTKGTSEARALQGPSSPWRVSPDPVSQNMDLDENRRSRRNCLLRRSCMSWSRADPAGSLGADSVT